MLFLYNKLKLKELEECITKKQGITYIDEVGLNLIKDSLKVDTDDLKHLNNEREDNTLDDETATDIEDSSLNKELFKALIEQLKIKDIQLQEKDLQIHELHKLIENNQVLLKDKPQDVKLLEEHFQGVDNKLADIRKEMDQRKQKFEAEEQNKGFFKFLKRSK